MTTPAWWLAHTCLTIQVSAAHHCMLHYMTASTTYSANLPSFRIWKTTAKGGGGEGSKQFINLKTGRIWEDYII